MQSCDACSNIAVQPTKCACALFVAAMALDFGCGGYTWLPKIVPPTKRFVRCYSRSNLALGAPYLHRLLGVAPPKHYFRP